MRLLEQMSRGLPDDDGSHSPEGVPEVEELAERAGAVVLGPGLGRTDSAVEFARGVARAVQVPLLIDADGLNAHAGELELLREREAPTVLTPHEGELGRLLGIEAGEVAEHRLDCAREAAERSGAVVLLKGDDTLVAAPGGPVAVKPRRHARAGHGRHRRRAVGPDRRAARQGPRPARGRARRARARARRPRGGRAPGRHGPRDGPRRDRRLARRAQ